MPEELQRFPFWCLSGHLQGEMTRGAKVQNSYKGFRFGRGSDELGGVLQ